MANRFWVGGTGNTSDTAHWSATTGGAGGETVPVAGDSVTFDSNSGTAATVTVDVALSAASITINKSDLTLLHNAGTTLTGAMTLTAGTLNTNGQTCSWGQLSIPAGSGVRTLTLGASAIALSFTGSATAALSVSGSASNVTITANTAVITLTGNTGSGGLGNKNWSGTSIIISGVGADCLFSGPGTCANFTRTGTAAKTDGLAIGADFTVSGAVTLGGQTVQGTNRLNVRSNVVGTSRTITAAAYVITGDVDFMDINLAYSGGASWTNAGSAYIGDALGNAGAVTTNATVSAAQTATGTASFTWSTHGWTSRVPLPQDDVVINNAFIAGRTVTADMPRLGRDLTFSCTGTPLFSRSITTTIFGSQTYIAAMTLGGGQQVIFAGRGSHTVTSAGLIHNGYFLQQGPGGTYTLQDDFIWGASATVALYAGTFDANGHNVSCAAIVSTPSTSRTIKLGSGTWTLAQTGSVSVWQTNNVGTLTLVPGTAIIDITATDSGVTKTFQGGGLTYPTLRHTATGSAALTITGNNTFANLDLECTTARTVTFPASGMQTILSALTLQGAEGQLLSLVSSTPGTATNVRYLSTGSYTNSNISQSADVNIYGYGGSANDSMMGIG